MSQSKTSPGHFDSFRGVNNVADPSRLKPGELTVASNVDVDKTGMLRRRGGRSLIHPGSCRSVFGSSHGLLFAEGEFLKLMDEELNVTTLRSGLSPTLPITCAEVVGELFFSNGEESGRIKSGVSLSWGVPVPTLAPGVVVGAGGSVPPGQYRCVATFFDAEGRESGASDPSMPVEFREANASLIITPPPFLEGVVAVGLYLSLGGEYFRVGFQTDETPITVGRFIQAEPLKTQFFTTPPPGHIIRYYRGRIYVAFEKWVLYSEVAPNYHLFSPDENCFEFEEKVRMLEFTTDGMYVSADRTYFLSGMDPSEMSLFQAEQSKSVPGTSSVVDAQHLALEGIQGSVVVWLAVGQGVLAGLAGGIVLNLTGGRFAMPDSQSGSSVFRVTQHLKQMVSSVKMGSVRTGDRVSVEVIRNGQTI